MELEDFEEIVDVDGVDITVGEGPHVRAGLDHGQVARAGRQGDVAPHQVALACHSGRTSQRSSEGWC